MGIHMIEELCCKHNDLTAKDIAKLKSVAENLGMIADCTGADIFIDCITRDPDEAVVVAQAKPNSQESLYKGSVVGELAYRSKEPAVLRTLDVGMPTSDMWAVTQENKNVRQNVSPIKNDEGRVIGVLIAEKDITDHVKTKNNLSVLSRTTEQLMEALMTSRHRDHNLPYHDSDGIVMFNESGISTYANPVAETIYRKLGYLDKLEGIHFSNMALDQVVFQDVLEKRQLSHNEVKVGSLVLNLKYAVMKNRDFNVSGVVMLMRDETDVKAKEKELILKSVAIREIHHRVKNNLQTIASLLRLQSRRVDNVSAKTAFSESISRVLSIAATHEILAQNGVDDVDLLTMLQRIKSSIVDYSVVGGKEVRISIQGDTFMCNSDTATSIALVTNEVIQNSLKHAFKGREKGTICVEICKASTYGNIVITDDGVGFDVGQVREGALGTRIVNSIVKDKLHGTLTTASGDGGTKVLFDFPLDEATSQDNPEYPSLTQTN
ncbi:Two-component sensor histidine kinase, contains HisKA and HATPase domains [Desulfoluna spongiiphila]|uniref:histidine kinase n=2 Tax=Desulfoluna spongiiphila TaxID=419481 RepID=A0A1G5E9T8_9BACT|nr:Two-component sensor histidine kinase, contains HisKA and HATPase domains [Desulfoluna spongiiphila]